MRKFDDIQQKEKVELLNKCWMSHDGMWFFHCLQAFGIEAANRMNKSAIKSLASLEIPRLRKVLDHTVPIEDTERLRAFFDEAAKFMVPDFMHVSFSYPEKNKIAWAFESGNCFAYKGIKMAGVIDDYECGVLYRIGCWLDELNIRHLFTPQIGKCHMHCSGSCSGEIELFA